MKAGLARIPAIAACPTVRPVSPHRKASVSALSKLSSMFSRLRWARWSPAGNSVSRVILPESVSDACGTREMRPTFPSETVRFRRERETRLLLEHVEHGLQRDDRSLAERIESLFDPSDGRAQRHSELANLALGPELVELFPERVVVDRVEARVVQLVEVDVVGAEPAERGFELRSDRRGLPVLTPFRLALAGEGSRCRSRTWS